MRLLTRAFFLGGRALHLASTIFLDSAAATLSLAELRANIQRRWETFNDLASDVEGGLAEWEVDLADRLARPGASVLIVGCGSGRDVLAYLARGCRVTGVDPVPRALALARQVLGARGLRADLIEGFIDETVVPGTFDVVLFGWTSYGQIPETARRIRTLKRLADQLNPGGHIALDYEVYPRPLSIVVRSARLVGAIARSDWRVEERDIIEWRQRDGVQFFSYLHAFTPHEIEAEAAAAGLEIVYRRDPPNHPVYILKVS